MDPTVTQMMAQQMGLTPEQYAAIQGGDPSSLLANYVSDPVMASLLSSMMQRKEQSDETEEPDRYEVLERRLQRARRVIRMLRENLASADAMALYIAEIFGACRVCWGLNKLCPRCKGQGAPGYADPAEEELIAWVEPALKKLGLSIVRNE